jgi:succinate dehydrogenase / fumarate reductase membrane anchor subunit
VEEADNPSSPARVPDLGSAREGARQWWMQRMTGVALIPLTLWLAASLLQHVADDYATLAAWLRRPPAAVLMALLLMALCYHMALGLKVIVEDYVHVERVKVPAVALIHLLSAALAVAGIFATLRIALTG